MATVLLIICYLSFLGRGMPDSITGAAWVMISEEFQVPDSFLSLITVTASLATAVTSLFSAWLIRKFGTFRITLLSIFALAFTLLGYYLSHEFILLCLLALPLGCSAGVIDNALNDYMANHYRALFLNVMHGVYGIGAALSPLLISVALNRSGNWRDGYFLSFCILCFIGIVFGISFPLWKKEKKSSLAEKEENRFPLTRQLRDKKVLAVCACIFLTNAIEAVFSAYGATYLVSGQSLSEAEAPKVIMTFCLCMGFGRMISGFMTLELSNRIMLFGCAGALLLPTLFLLFELPVWTLYLVFGLVGFLNGPIYPLMIYLTPENFGKENSASVMGTEIATAYTGFMIAQFLLSFIIGVFSVGIFPIFSFAIGILLFIFLYFAQKPPKSMASK